MKILVALLAAGLLLAGCSSSDDAAKPAPTTASDPSTPFDRDALEQQTREQAAQREEALKQLAKEVDEKAASQGDVVDIVIKDGKVTPQGARVEVKAGRPVTLRVTSDASEELHVHSDPEHTYEVTAGDQKDFTFTVDTPGQVAVEAHHLDVTIVQLVVRP